MQRALQHWDFYTSRNLLTRDGERIVLIVSSRLDWKKYHTPAYMKAYYYFFSALARDPVARENGLCFMVSGKVGLCGGEKWPG